jgi:hypothetical protein
MKCPTCIAAKQTSQVTQDMTQKPVGSQNGVTHRFFDEDGTPHEHHPVWSCKWKCSKGHTWQTNEQIPCPPCVHKKKVVVMEPSFAIQPPPPPAKGKTP